MGTNRQNLSDITNWDEFLTPYFQTVEELTVKLNFISNELTVNGLHSPIERVYGRVKHVASIIEKANRKDVPFNKIREKIEDIAGVRVICKFVEDIDHVVQLLRMRDGFDLKIIQERDYINNAKPSGYQSYHVIVRYKVMTVTGPMEISAEIQIRTLAMNFWATIEHSLKYKYNGNIPEDLKQRLIASAQAAHKLDIEMSKIHDEITEAQQVVLVREGLVNSITKKIHNLYFIATLEKANELNREFIEIYQTCNLEELSAFNDKLTTIAHVYNVDAY
ncbi:hypothetical protein AGMMS49975_01580 [Clostridia bacterium]|nr:hypothetical protein AGMMS49975_01580 [Clostridia bacterium]GHU74736.1 hypothetical protein FACS1894188_03920 [Clostridia bacterium]